MKCGICRSEAKRAYLAHGHDPDVWLCEDHYKPVREWVEAMRKPSGFIPYKDIPSGFEVPHHSGGESPDWVMYEGVKFVPEKAKVERFGLGYNCKHDDGTYNYVVDADANALYEFMEAREE